MGIPGVDTRKSGWRDDSSRIERRKIEAWRNYGDFRFEPFTLFQAPWTLPVVSDSD